MGQFWLFFLVAGLPAQSLSRHPQAAFDVKPSSIRMPKTCKFGKFGDKHPQANILIYFVCPCTVLVTVHMCRHVAHFIDTGTDTFTHCHRGSQLARIISSPQHAAAEYGCLLVGIWWAVRSSC